MFHVLFPVVSYILRKVNSQSGGVTLVDLGTGTSFDVKTLAPSVDYTSLTTDNFIVEVSDVSSRANGTGSHSGSAGNYTTGSFVLTKSYDSVNGILSAYGTVGSYYVAQQTGKLYATGSSSAVGDVHTYLVY